MQYTVNNYENLLPYYPQVSELKSRQFYHTGFEDSLEIIVSKEDSEADLGMLEKVFSNKRKNLKATVKALFNEISLRERTNLFLIYKIDADIFKQNAYMEQVKIVARHTYSLELLKDLSATRMILESNVLDLEKEKRREYLECWHDLSFLKKYLLSALKDYWDLSKRTDSLLYDSASPGEDENRERH